MGSLWLLGPHRLLCGDATNPEDVSRLVQGETAQLGLHDPPYGLRAKGISWGFGDGKRGTLALRGTFSPVAGDDSPFDPTHLLTSGQTVILWGANHYADKLPPSPAWLLWDKRVDLSPNDQSDGESAWVSRGNTLRIFRHRWSGFIRDSERGVKRVHPTQKPIKLFEWCIERYSQPGDIITDWYAGSGTTLIAAHNTGRRAYLMEISPEYCEIIVQRWEALTGLKARVSEEVSCG